MISAAATGLGSRKRVVRMRMGAWSSSLNSSARVIGSRSSLPI